MSDSPPRPSGRSSGVRARRSAVDHIADHGEPREFPELFDGATTVDAASISTSTFSIVPQALPATIDEDLLEDDDVVGSEVDPESARSAALDDVRAPDLDGPAPTPVVVATIDPTPAAPEATVSSKVREDTPAASPTRTATPSKPATPRTPRSASTSAESTPRMPGTTAPKKTASSKAAPSKAASSKPASSKPARSTVGPSKPAASRNDSTQASSTPTVSKPGPSRPAASKPAASKPAAARTAASKPAVSTSAPTGKPAPTKAAPTKPAPTTAPRGKASVAAVPPVAETPASEQAAAEPSLVVDVVEPDTSVVETSTAPDTAVEEERTPVGLATTRIVVDLPPSEEPEVPADERALAIDEVPVTTAEELATPTNSVSVEAAPAPSSERDDRVEEAQPAPAFAGMSVARALAGAPESSSMLTAERLLDERRDSRRVPEGFWQKLVFDLSGRRVRLADSRAARARTALTERIATPLPGGARFVPVLTRKGGVGKTTVTTLLGMALADARDDRVIAVDANPDRGTLAERLSRRSEHTVRDLVRGADEVAGYAEFSALVSRDATRLDVLASDTDPHLSQAFDADDYDVVARLASQYYSIVLTDCGTGIVHSVMGATLRRADSLVIVSGTSVDEARSASETLSWLDANGYEALAADAVVVVNSTTPGTPAVRLDEITKHFESRVRSIVRVPFDAHLATGAAITFADLRPETRLAVRELAAAVVEGLPGGRPRKAGNRG